MDTFIATSTLSGQTVNSESTGPSGNEGNPIRVFSAGLVQITGIATLFGGSSVEELAIGLKAAPGLPWASMSCFGILKIVKVLLAGVASDRWRHLLGMRSAIVDDARGFALWTKAALPHVSLPGIGFVEQKLGLSLDVAQSGPYVRDLDDRFTKSIRNERLSGWRSSFAFDRSLKATLTTTSPFTGDKGVSIVHFRPGTTTPDHRFLDGFMILASTVKLAEVITLRMLGSRYLCWSSAVGWLCTFAMAVVLHWWSLGRENPTKFRRASDFLIGEMPSFNRPGGNDKIVILDQLTSVRSHGLWRAAWLIGAVSNTIGLGVTFYILAKEVEAVNEVIYAWVAFQFGWVLLRSVVYYTLPDADVPWNENVTIESWEEASPISRTRVLRLLLAASIQQTHDHLRGFASYQEDLLTLASPETLVSVLEQASWRTCNALPRDAVPVGGSRKNTRVEAMLGDIWLRTLVWATDTKVDNADLYDAVLVLVSTPSGSKHLVSAVRVMSTAPIKSTGDVEKPTPSFDPRWRMSRDKIGSWIYWLPVVSETPSSKCDWIEIKCDPYSVLGPLQNYRVVSDEELGKNLAAGMFGISLRNTTDMVKVLDTSRACAEVLLRMVTKENTTIP